MMIITREMLSEMYAEIQILKAKVDILENDRNMLMNELSKTKTNIKEINHILKDDFYVEVFKNAN